MMFANVFNVVMVSIEAIVKNVLVGVRWMERNVHIAMVMEYVLFVVVQICRRMNNEKTRSETRASFECRLGGFEVGFGH